jgi:hypothetical protein
MIAAAQAATAEAAAAWVRHVLAVVGCCCCSPAEVAEVSLQMTQGVVATAQADQATAALV